MQQSLNTMFSKTGRTSFFNKARLLSIVTLFLAFYANLAYAQSGSDFVSDIINANGAASSSDGSQSGMHFGRNYFTNNPGGTSAVRYDGNYLGTFNRNSSSDDTLRLNAKSTFTAKDGESVREIQFLYRVFRADAANDPNQQGNFIPVALNYVSGDVGSTLQADGTYNSATSTWSVTNNNIDLLQNISTPGSYVVQVYFQASVSDPNSTTNPTRLISDSNNGNYYSANIYVFVDGQSIVSTSWTGTSSNDGNWFNDLNWTDANGNHFTPNTNTDVEIPVLDNSQNYPRIYGPNIARVRNLVLDGNPDGSVGARLQLESSKLLVYGLFQDLNYGVQGFNQYGGTFVLAGRDQIFDASPTLQKFEITGGGTKRFTQGINITNTLTFTPNSDGSAAGIIVLPIARGTANTITLDRMATIVNETEGAYIQGAVTTTRLVAQSTPNDFGKIGVELTALSNSPGNVTVTRSYSIYKGPNSSVSVRRGFVFSTADNAITNYNLKFTYLTAILNGISPANLAFFQSKSGGAPFTPLGRDVVDQVNKTVTKNNINVAFLSTFTLGDQTRPLPVTLASFTATGTAQGAALKWITASELNNKGVGIERQVVGATAWESVGYVTGTNAANGSSYSFLDKTIPSEATQVYYRLRQEDKTGELTYSPVAAISRAAAGAALTLSPVPLDGSPLLVSFAEAGQAGAVIEVVNMQGQRVGHFASEGSAEGVSLPLSHLAPGVYIVNVQVPGQATRHARFVKQ